MADYSDSKSITGAVYPDNAITQVWGHTEPLITPEQLVDRWLWGVNLQSRFKDPLTGKPYVITTDMLKDYIKSALEEAEIDLGLVIMPTQIDIKKAYHRRDYQHWGYFMLNHKPVSSIETMSIQFADGTEAFDFPKDWIEVANLVYGQVNLVPATYGGLLAPTGGQSTNLLYLQFFNQPWVSALIRFVYTAGFPNGSIPRIINDYIGIIAAIDVYSKLGPALLATSSTSLNIDGIGQSQSINPNVFALRIKDLKEKRMEFSKKIKKVYRRIVVGSV